MEAIDGVHQRRGVTAALKFLYAEEERTARLHGTVVARSDFLASIAGAALFGCRGRGCRAGPWAWSRSAGRGRGLAAARRSRGLLGARQGRSEAARARVWAGARGSRMAGIGSGSRGCSASSRRLGCADREREKGREERRAESRQGDDGYQRAAATGEEGA
jgi:hypothetical protein